MTASVLPPEIFLLIAEELAKQSQFDAIAKCARTSRTMSSIMLPVLYRNIHHYTPASDHSGTTKNLLQQWRSLILSSIGKTAAPYCLYIKSLDLEDLKTQLESSLPGMPIHMYLRDQFFARDMEAFRVTRQIATRKAGRPPRPALDLQAIIDRVGESITKFIKEASDQENRTVAMTSLKGQYLRMELLPTWVSRLSNLTSLSLQDGSVLNGELAAVIRDKCPSFRELVCFYCQGNEVDEPVAAFISGLNPQSLQSFDVISMNSLGQATFEALNNRHGPSLVRLGLRSLQSTAINALDALRDCSSLYSLALEANKYQAAGSLGQGVSDAIIVWLKQCTSLRELSIEQMPGAATVMAKVLTDPQFRLEYLDLVLVDIDKNLYEALRHQTKLTAFFLRSNDESLDVPGENHSLFMSSLARLDKARTLELMNTCISRQDLEGFSTSNPELEELSFDGMETADDSWLSALAANRRLQSVNINAQSAFSFPRLLQFITAEMPLGLRLHVMMQSAELGKLAEDEEKLLSVEAEARGGRFEVTYTGDPEELHESDFSD